MSPHPTAIHGNSVHPNTVRLITTSAPMETSITTEGTDNR